MKQKLTELDEVCCEIHHGVTLHQGIGNGKGQRETVPRAGSTAELIYDGEAIPVYTAASVSVRGSYGPCWYMASYFMMNAISRISTENVDMFVSTLSSVDMRVKRSWMMGRTAHRAGTKLPI